ncbi:MULTISPECIES: hypothetical protein [Pectobacterium]|uniref:hypothetical protein n=1 Tax=Pectobacterium TaxID=122277 RepID=UPI0018DA4E87|nr:MULTISPECIES: hypothetical protein [Pectobacterium]MDY4386850.1 hypothetical protein [Pectobacterium aroidearum]QPI42342.1 hypothetical protein I2D83_18175 [Pectobacterium aroidearum]
MANDEIKNKLVSVLASQQAQGKTPEQAVDHILQALGGRAGDVSRISVLTSTLIADVLYTVYQDVITHHQVAVILHKLGYAARDIAVALHAIYPQLSVQDVGQLLQSPEIYPTIDRVALLDALTYAHFSKVESEQAADALGV